MSETAKVDPLTVRQRQYVNCRIGGMNGVDSYRTAYSCDGWTTGAIWEASNRLENNAVIAREILDGEIAAAKKAVISREWVLRWLYMRATYNANELMTLDRGACRCCYGDEHKPQWRWHEFVEALATAERDKDVMPDLKGGWGYNSTLPPVAGCTGCDGKGVPLDYFRDTRTLSAAAQAAYEGVKRTKDGWEIKMADKAQAMEQLSKMCGFNVADMTHPADVPAPGALADLPAVEAAKLYQRIFAPQPATKH